MAVTLLTAVSLGLVSLFSDFTLLLHPLQISIVLIFVGVAVAAGRLYVLRKKGKKKYYSLKDSTTPSCPEDGDKELHPFTSRSEI